MFELPTPQDDGLFIPTVGEWSRDKHYFLMRYIDAFVTAMKDKPWAGLHYIDIFAGAGIERLKDSKELDWGSALIAAKAPHSFDKLHLCEKNKQAYDALNTRISKIKPDSQVLHGDANEKIQEILEDIPDRTLSLAFLDPYGLHLDFDTLRALAKRRADLIIFFPDHLDALRNWEGSYLDKPDSNLDRYLGKGSDWRSIINKTPQARRAEVLRELYVKQVRTLGYTKFEYERISMKGHPLYILIFCSRSERGVDLWRKTSQMKPDGQRTFDFDKD